MPSWLVATDALGFRKEDIQILSDEDGFEDPTFNNIVCSPYNHTIVDQLAPQIRFLGQFVEQGREQAEYIFLCKRKRFVLFSQQN
jgi:hypothetical protein